MSLSNWFTRFRSKKTSLSYKRLSLCSFSADAKDYASKNLNARVVLIDGAEFGLLMVRHGIGVQKRKTFSIVDIDEDYFED